MVGAGGNGSIFLSHLCRIHHAWTKLGGEPFNITIYDPDKVSEANLGRQIFCSADIGLPKAEVLAERLRLFFGIRVKAVVQQYKGQHDNLIVGCTDNLAARKVMAEATKPKTEPRTGNNHPGYHYPGCYWLDLGNGAESGQVILGGHGLPNFFDVFPDQLTAKEDKTLPSCSVAESLERQDLFINSTIATYAGQLLWKLMRRGSIEHHGYVINLQSGMTVPIPVK